VSHPRGASGGLDRTLQTPVDRPKSGAASGVVSMSRMIGGSVGLAVMGRARDDDRALEARLEPPAPAGARAKLTGALGSGATPDGQGSPHLVHAQNDAFVSSLASGLEVGAAVAFVGALLALWLLGRVRTRPETRPSEQRAPEAVTA
jgi:hypothetical protein